MREEGPQNTSIGTRGTEGQTRVSKQALIQDYLGESSIDETLAKIRESVKKPTITQSVVSQSNQFRPIPLDENDPIVIKAKKWGWYNTSGQEPREAEGFVPNPSPQVITAPERKLDPIVEKAKKWGWYQSLEPSTPLRQTDISSTQGSTEPSVDQDIQTNPLSTSPSAARVDQSELSDEEPDLPPFLKTRRKVIERLRSMASEPLAPQGGHVVDPPIEATTTEIEAAGNLSDETNVTVTPTVVSTRDQLNTGDFWIKTEGPLDYETGRFDRPAFERKAHKPELELDVAETPTRPYPENISENQKKPLDSNRRDLDVLVEVIGVLTPPGQTFEQVSSQVGLTENLIREFRRRSATPVYSPEVIYERAQSDIFDGIIYPDDPTVRKLQTLLTVDQWRQLCKKVVRVWQFRTRVLTTSDAEKTMQAVWEQELAKLSPEDTTASADETSPPF